MSVHDMFEAASHVINELLSFYNLPADGSQEVQTVRLLRELAVYNPEPPEPSK